MATPVVRFETNPAVIVESESTSLVFTFQLSEPPPSGGVTVTVNGSVAQNLTQLNLFNIIVTGGEFPIGDTDFSGFDFKITSQTATISIPIFQDGVAEAPTTVTYTLAPGQGYTVDAGARQDSVIFRDDPAPPTNNPPVANDDSGSIAENQILNGNVLSNDSDPEGNPITVTALNGNTSIGSAITLDSGAIVTLNGNGTYSYNPNGRFNYLNNGQTTGDSFTYTLSDGQGGSEQGVVTLTITGDSPVVIPVDPLFAVDDIGNTADKQVLNGNVLSNDYILIGRDGIFYGGLKVTAINGNTNSIGTPITLASGAIVTLNEDGTYVYNPNGQFNYLNDGQTATDSFTYNITDIPFNLAFDNGGGVIPSDYTATVTITILGVTDAPPGFDPAQYGASYSDLIVNIGYNLGALTNHYVRVGQAEGRSPDLFDEFRYLASNPDLITAFGLNGAAATDHYIRSGYFENRRLTSFDPAQYGASNPDLIPVFGYNLAALTNHYVTAGQAEGRSKDLFNETWYLASNPDLITAFGPNGAAATEHYIRSGYFENRPLTSFDSSQYLASHGDLIGAFGYNSVEATNHYVFSGYSEGRAADSFNETRYLASNPDLITAFGYNPQAATNHYIQAGFREGRNPNLFNPDIYIASNPDLVQAIKYNLQAGTDHYILYGAAEGRQTNAFNPLTYLDSYDDLRQAFGFDLTAATRHYIDYGFDEGRISGLGFPIFIEASPVFIEGTASSLVFATGC